MIQAQNIVKRKFIRIAKDNWQLYLVLLIPLIWLVIFKYIPMAGNVLAFKDYSARAGVFGSPWVGLKYFRMFFFTPNFTLLLRNTLRISLYWLIAGFPIPIILALALNECRYIKFKRFVQTATYAPYFISTVVLVGIISQLFHARLGIVNQMIVFFGGLPIDFMGKSSMFTHLYVLSGFWQNAGYSSVIYIAALTGVDPELKEAATIDGATRFQKILHIDIPGIMPTIVITLILNFGQIMSVGFEKAYLMQNPANLSTSEIISTYVYKVGFENAQYSFATAIGLFNSLINLALILLCNFACKRLSEISIF